MYTLYYSPGASSLVTHCLLEELGARFEVRRVDFATQEHQAEAFRRINPKAKVPALVTAEGVLTETVALTEYLCDRHGDGALLGRPGTWRRLKAIESIATLATEIHPLFNRFFHAEDFSAHGPVQEEVTASGAERLLEWFGEQDAALTGEYWSGDKLTAPDFHFMVIARWGRWLQPNVLQMTNIEPFFRRMTERPAVARAMEREGIKPFGA